MITVSILRSGILCAAAALSARLGLSWLPEPIAAKPLQVVMHDMAPTQTQPSELGTRGGGQAEWPPPCSKDKPVWAR